MSWALKRSCSASIQGLHLLSCPLCSQNTTKTNEFEANSLLYSMHDASTEEGSIAYRISSNKCPVSQNAVQASSTIQALLFYSNTIIVYLSYYHNNTFQPHAAHIPTSKKGRAKKVQNRIACFS